MNYYRIRQRFPRPKLADVLETTILELAKYSLPPGARIAIAVGSRGIANLSLIVRAVASWVAEHGGEPFIVPAMGSHAGATAEGQKTLLKRLGVTGATIFSSMEVVELQPGVFMDKAALKSDGVIVINRIKPHTSFHGRYESGLMKMLAVGLSKHAGAKALHAGGVAGLREGIPLAARRVLATGKILFGVAIVENAYDETLALEVIPAAQIPEREPALLDLAKANMPRLPVEDVDVLVVDEMGKEISGTGMDTNVIGRLRITGEPEPASPRIKRIFVRDVHGDSAYGIGLADVTTRRLIAQANWDVTRTNVETSGFTLRGVIPRVTDLDDEAVAWALEAGNRVVRIPNTLHLETLIISEPVLQNIAGRATVEVLGPAKLWDVLTSSPPELR